MQDFYEVCRKKQSGELDYEWLDIALMFNMKSGEAARNKYKRYKKINNLSNNNLKALILSDLHIPDHKEDMVLDVITKNKNVDIIILAGDILDCKAVSSFYDEEITILDYEMIKAHELLTKIRNITKAKIILIKGNHEARINRFFAKNAKAMGSSVVETEILYKLANGFTIKNIKMKTRTFYEPIENVEYCDGRTYILGDLLVNHPSTFRKDYMKTVWVMYNEKFKNKYPNSNVFIIGHTHQMGQVFSQEGKVLIESGCLCNSMSYADEDDRPFKLQQHGYIYLEMKDDKVIIDTIKLNYLGYDN